MCKPAVDINSVLLCSTAMVVVTKGGFHGTTRTPPRSATVAWTLPFQKVDDTSTQLTGVRVFSKLNTNSGFWKTPLAKESCLLTTFIKLFGRYCFNKFHFEYTVCQSCLSVIWTWSLRSWKSALSHVWCVDVQNQASRGWHPFESCDGKVGNC